MTPLLSISLDWLTIARLLAALGWGFAFALFIYKQDRGIRLRNDQTWVTVVIGIGIDLLLSFPDGWGVVSAVIACSSIGILVFAIFYREEKLGGYNAMDRLMKAMGLCSKAIDLLESGFDLDPKESHVVFSQVLKLLFQIQRKLLEARNGDLVERTRRR